MTNVLRDDDRLLVDGELLKNRVVELALALDSDLLRRLLKSEGARRHFFVDVDGILVFDSQKFQRFVNNKDFLPNSYTTFKNKIGLVQNDEYISTKREVVLAWPYKDCVLEGGQTQEEVKRTEIFWNETLAPDQIDRLLSPKVLTHFSKFDSTGEHGVNAIGSRENWLIKGNNLLALHTLSPVFLGQVDCIYIDPPYNPETKSNTFLYNNSFTHSTWLTFIKNRLDVAKTLLRPDGVLIVAIDANEQARLGVLLEEMFPAHEVHCITIVHNPRGVQGTNFSYTHENAFFVFPRDKKVIVDRVIAKDEIEFSNFSNWGAESLRSDGKHCFYPVIIEKGAIVGFGDVLPNDVHPESQTVKVGKQYHVYPIDVKGVERKWRYARQSVDEIKNLLRPKETDSGYQIEIGKDFGQYKTVWIDPRYDANEHGTQVLKALVPDCVFPYPKSLYNVYDCLYAAVGEKKDALVLDFFAGSGTTAHALLEMNKVDGGNRHFILCEQMHYVESCTRERIRRVIEQNAAGDFLYAELMSCNELFMERLQAAETSEALLALWDEMQETAFLSYQLSPGKYKEATTLLKALTLDNQRAFLIEALDKNMLYVPLSEIDDEFYKVDEPTKQLNQTFTALAGANA